MHMFTVGSHGHGDSSSVDPAIFCQIQHGQAVSTYPRVNKTLIRLELCGDRMIRIIRIIRIIRMHDCGKRT